MVVFAKRTTCAAIAVTSFLICLNVVHAQNKKLYSLAELVDSTKHYFPSLLQKEALANSAKAGITEARHAYLPKLSISDEAVTASANSLPGSYFPIGTIPSVSGSINAQNNSTAASGNIASLYAEYELVNFGLRGAKTKNAEAFAGLQQADFDKELYVVKWQIGRLYFDLLKNKYQLAIDEQNIKRNEFIYSVITALTSSGINAGVDSLIAKAELSKTKIGYNNREGEIERLHEQLAFYTGIEAGIDIDTTQKKYANSNALLPVSIDTFHNPLIEYYSKQESLFKSAETLARKMYLPKVMLAGGGWGRGSSIDYTGQYKNFSNGFGYQRFSYGIAIGVTYDLLNGIRKHDRLSVSRLQTTAVGFEAQQQKNALKLGSAQADIAIKLAEKNLAELPTQLQAASGAFDQKVAQYKAGLINLIDLTNASFVLYTTQSAYVQTQNDWLLANLNKAATAGQLDSFIQSIKQ
ncbi:MAG: TolC family protein [Chitinophagaceae bacterium]